MDEHWVDYCLDLNITMCNCGKRRAGVNCWEHQNLLPFPGSSTVEHSAVNRRVASSNLARGAKFSFFFNYLQTCPSPKCYPGGKWRIDRADLVLQSMMFAPCA
jgi:hypothetical protein